MLHLTPLLARHLLGAVFLFAALLEIQTVSGVTLAWNANSEPDVAGYRLHYGTTSGQYSQHVEVQSATSATVSNLNAQQTYFFAVTAYNTSDLESLASTEVSYTVPSPSPTPTPPPPPTPTPTPSATPTPTPSATPTPTPSATPTPTPSATPTPTPSATPTPTPSATPTPTPTPTQKPIITAQPQNQTVTVGQTATFSVTATGSGLTYEWKKNNARIAGATGSSYTTPSATQANNGARFKVVVRNGAGSVTSRNATLRVNPAPSATQPNPTRVLLNISTRAYVDSGDRVMIGGFILSGVNPKNVLLRSLGPSLSGAGVAGALADPVLELYNSAGEMVSWNDNWATGGQTLPEGMTPSRSNESALVASLPPGSYTTVVRGGAAASGVALFELYDLEPGASQISNVSTRAEVGTGDNLMIGGFTIGGAEPTRVIIRAIGPSLRAARVAEALQDPVLELRNPNGSLLFQNDNWRDTQEAQIIASSVPPTDDRESAIVATLPPASYTVLVRGASNSTGVVSLEVYNLETD